MNFKPRFLLLFSTGIAFGGFAAFFAVTANKEIALSYTKEVYALSSPPNKPESSEKHTIKVGIGLFNYGTAIDKGGSENLEFKSKYNSYDQFLKDSGSFADQVFSWRNSLNGKTDPTTNDTVKINWSASALSNIQSLKNTIESTQRWFLTSAILFGVWGLLFVSVLIIFIVWIIKTCREKKVVETNFDLFWQIS